MTLVFCQCIPMIWPLHVWVLPLHSLVTHQLLKTVQKLFYSHSRNQCKYRVFQQLYEGFSIRVWKKVVPQEHVVDLTSPTVQYSFCQKKWLVSFDKHCSMISPVTFPTVFQSFLNVWFQFDFSYVSGIYFAIYLIFFICCISMHCKIYWNVWDMFNSVHGQSKA